MAGNKPVKMTGSKRTGVVSEARRTRAAYTRARCEYCRGWVAKGDHREIFVAGETKYVHRRHPRREGEENP